jgi:hypothetical protein
VGKDDVERCVPASNPLRPRGPGPCALLLLAALLVQAAPLRAAVPAEEQPDPERKAAASAHLKRGAELIDAEDLTGALAEFESAYRLVPDPSILHNFGVVYQGLGRNAAALEAFERFLAEASRAPLAVREHAMRAVQNLRPRVAELQVESDERGASILVDGRKLGETPQEKPIYLDPGSHRLSLERTDLGTIFAERLELSAGQRLTVPARRERPAAAVARETMAAPELPERRWQRPVAWAAAAGAVVAAGVFGTELLLRARDFNRFNSAGCGTDPADKGGPECPGLLARGQRDERGAVGSGVAAGVLGIGAAVLFFTLPPRAGGVGLSVQTTASGLGLRLHGAF